MHPSESHWEPSSKQHHAILGGSQGRRSSCKLESLLQLLPPSPLRTPSSPPGGLPPISPCWGSQQGCTSRGGLSKNRQRWPIPGMLGMSYGNMRPSLELQPELLPLPRFLLRPAGGSPWRAVSHSLISQQLQRWGPSPTVWGC